VNRVMVGVMIVAVVGVVMDMLIVNIFVCFAGFRVGEFPTGQDVVS
jgi:hypothetical protein